MKAALTIPLVVALAACVPTVRRFEAVLAAHDSATQALTEWCGRQGLAPVPEIRAIADRATSEAPSAATRKVLGVTAGEPVAFRHVRLVCGDQVLSVAKNWYVPARLAPEMNRVLETTDTPFGKVVAALDFRRERLTSQRGRTDTCPPDTVLAQRALLRRSDGLAISMVVECYTPAILKDHRAG